MVNEIDKKNKRLPDWVKWPDVLALAQITGKANITIYAILVGDRSDKKVRTAIEQYKEAKEQLTAAQDEIVTSLKEKFNAES